MVRINRSALVKNVSSNKRKVESALFTTIALRRCLKTGTDFKRKHQSRRFVYSNNICYRLVTFDIGQVFRKMRFLRSQ